MIEHHNINTETSLAARKIICIVVNGEKFQSHALTSTLIAQCPMSNSSELFSYTTIILRLIDLLFFSFLVHTHTHTHTHTHSCPDTWYY